MAEIFAFVVLPALCAAFMLTLAWIHEDLE